MCSWTGVTGCGSRRGTSWGRHCIFMLFVSCVAGTKGEEYEVVNVEYKIATEAVLGISMGKKTIGSEFRVDLSLMASCTPVRCSTPGVVLCTVSG